jgi:hypothetical protein
MGCGEDLVGSAVAPHRIDGDREHGAH